MPHPSRPGTRAHVVGLAHGDRGRAASGGLYDQTTPSRPRSRTIETMRTVGLLLSLCVLGCLIACSGKSDANAAPDPTALKAQRELVERRDALMAQRKK